MGIRSLNYYIRLLCPTSIKNIHLKELAGKTIVIDISIYLYRFKENGTIIENMYIMCRLFKKYGITPIFIFDGPPPCEKYEIIKQRHLKKKQAEKEYQVLKKNLNNNLSKQKRLALMEKMKSLEKQCIRVKGYEIGKVKKLLQALGINYLLAEGEADAACAKMVMEGKAYACLSDDMDLFVYGCPMVLRCLDLTKKRVLSYNLPHILEQFDIPLNDFRRLCILTGTDYSPHTRRKKFGYYYKLYQIFKNTKESCFVDWLSHNNNNNNSLYQINKTEALFDINSIQLPSCIKNTTIDMNALQDILAKDHFIFPPTTC